ncbi:MAG: hypothetical protein JXK07_03240 [Spirochaetes bacterium]|nr:hypothetical protein [Spirochaetota bacterium]MBN2770691.1 hypothetical protein [Spirochaetota bacterium]HRX16939.1 hypothetical protein [Spirochaetota bacterium]
MDKLTELMTNLVPFAILLCIGAAVSALFYYVKKRDLFGGFAGGMVIAIAGALLGIFLDKFLLEYIIIVLKFLVYQFNVDIIAGFIGAYGAVYMMNKLNHDKKRDRY